MNARLVTVILAVALALPAFAAGASGIRADPDPQIASGTLQRGLDAARKKWKAAHVRSYRYDVSVSCFCPPSNVRYVVRNGTPKVPARGDKAVATVPRRFRRIQSAIDRGVADLDVTYGKRGVPKSFYIDGSRMIADDEVGYAITRFTVLQ
jgi:hypothetical protein